MTAALIFGLAAGLLHLAGFGLYARRVFRGEIVPHGISWAMRCYGALVHLLIFAEIGMPVAILIQPAVSGLCAVAITVFALLRGSWLGPTRTDRCILATDIGLLLVFLALQRIEPDPGSALLIQSIVGITVIRKIVPYLPVLVTVMARPDVERPGAWAIWTLGYGMLFGAAMLSEMGPVYAAYPLAVSAVHLAIWAMVVRRVRLPTSEVPRRSPWSGPARIDAFPPYLA